MPASWKCSQCGLVNFALDQNCKRCGALIQSGIQSTEVQPPAAPVGIVLEDGYVMPPPPGPPPHLTGGTWREGSTLVMSKDASLPDYCVKCDAPADGFRLKRNLSWHHPALFLLILLAWLLYLILAMVLRKRATVYLGLCREHSEKRRTLLIAGFVILAVSVALIFGAIASDYPAVALLGLVGILASAIWLAFIARVVTVKKIDDQFVWLNGINENYLSRFPPLPQ
ncbi:MAG TPA: zinc finger protein [Pyrinomonadaceae bacterium]|nr:zinc finger protein [Pyrinomonadaceae bacterium]